MQVLWGVGMEIFVFDSKTELCDKVLGSRKGGGHVCRGRAEWSIMQG